MFIIWQVGQNRWNNNYMLRHITLLSWNLNLCKSFFLFQEWVPMWECKKRDNRIVKDRTTIFFLLKLFFSLVFIVFSYILIWEVKLWHNYDRFIIVHILGLWDMWLLKYYGWCMEFYYKFYMNGNKHV
jgi:hypothetical protein